MRCIVDDARTDIELDAKRRQRSGVQHVRSASSRVLGRCRRRHHAGDAGRHQPGRRRRSELHEQRPRCRARGQGAADLQIRAGAKPGQGDRQQLWQGSDRHPAADLQGHCRRLDEARARRDARIALARHRRGMGLRAGGTRAHHGDRSARRSRDQRFRSRRRLVFSARPRPHAAMPGRQAVSLHPDLRQWLFLRVRHVLHHRLDRATRPSRCWRRILACRNPLSILSRRRKCILRAARFRRRCRACRCRA